MGKKISNKDGDLRVWWNPQVPGKAFRVSVCSIEEGAKLLDVLADYDLFQYQNNIKPDYCNAGGLEQYHEDNGEGKPGWSDWYDEETGEEDPSKYLESKRNAKA